MRPLKKRLAVEETTVEEPTTRGRSQSTANPQQDSQRSLKGYRWICVDKTDRYTHKGAAFVIGLSVSLLPMTLHVCSKGNTVQSM